LVADWVNEKSFFKLSLRILLFLRYPIYLITMISFNFLP
jgi:hypothetical protein